jgi:guanine nucleotide-binding protein subunit alpha, other
MQLLHQRREVDLDEPIPEEYFECFSDLWADNGIQLGMLKGNECALHDNLV